MDCAPVELLSRLQELIQGIGPDVALENRPVRNDIHAAAYRGENRVQRKPCLLRELILHISNGVHAQAGPVQRVAAQMRSRAGMGGLSGEDGPLYHKAREG